MDQEVFDAYLDLEKTHFWRLGKRRLVLEWLEALSPPSDGRVLDVGGAACLVTRELRRYGDVTVVEPDEDMVDIVRRSTPFDVLQGGFPGLPVEGPFDVITLLDVLEHLDDDHGALIELRGLLRPGGVFMLTVPAYMWLWSEHDVILHHKRRYTRSQLVQRLHGAGFEVLRASYYTCALLPAMAAQRMAALVKSTLRPTKEARYRTTTPPTPINELFGHIMDLERRVLRSTSLPAGGSIIAVCR